MTESYIDLESRIAEDERIDEWPQTAVLENILHWLEEHRGELPGRTVTAGKVGQKAHLINGSHIEMPTIIDFLEALGVTVVPDPEPTDAEKLRADIDAFYGQSVAELADGHGLEHFLSKRGWTKAGGDEDTDRGRDWWIENANVNDAEDCEACGEVEDLCPVHHGMAVGIKFVTKKIAALGDDPELFNSIPNPPKAGGDDE